MASLQAPRVFPMHTFSGGVLSRTLDARSDTEKYYTAARRIHNVTVLRSGAGANRAGLEYIAPVKSAGAIVLPWVFDDDDRYILETGDGYIRFFQDGQRIVTDGATPLHSIVQHYVPGDIVTAIHSTGWAIFYAKIPNVAVPPATSSSTWHRMETISDPLLAAGTVGIYEIPTPYHADVLLDLRVAQSADVQWIVHPTHPPYELRRYAHTRWTLLPANFAPSISGPSGLRATGGSTGSLTRRYKVTAVKKDTLIESLPGSVVTTKSGAAVNDPTSGNILLNLGSGHGIVNGQTVFIVDAFPTTGAVSTTFEAKLEGNFYSAANVTATTIELSNTAGIAVPSGYSILLWGSGASNFAATAAGTVLDNGKLSKATHALTTGDEVLVIAVAGGTTDEAKAVLLGKTYVVTVLGADDFILDDSDGLDWTNDVGLVYLAKTFATKTNATAAQTVTLLWDAVPGAEKYYVYKQLNGVYGYLDTVQGLTYEDTTAVSPDTEDAPPRYYNPFRGVNKRPSAVSLHDQRLCFAGTNNKPADFWMSKVGDFLNFTHASPYKDDDAITGTIVGAQEIRHLLDFDTLVVLSNHALYFLEGDADGDITHDTVRARHRGRIGAGLLPPLVIADSALFTEARNGLVRDFRLDAIEFQKGRDLTVYAPSLFEGFELVQWCYQRIPESIVWAVRNDGLLVANTYVREQEINAWHTHDTGRSGLLDNGFGVLVGDPTQDAGFLSVATIPDGDEDSLYAVVERTINPTYQFGALYEPPDGYIIHGLGHHLEESQVQYVEALGGTLLEAKAISGSGGFPIRVTSNITPPNGSAVFLKDAFPTVGDPDTAFESRVEDRAYWVTGVIDGVSFDIMGRVDPVLPPIPAVPADYVGTFRVLDGKNRPAVHGIPPNIGKNSGHHGVIPGYAGPLPNPDEQWWRGTSTTEYIEMFTLMAAMGSIPTVAFTVHDHVSSPSVGADTVFHDGTPPNQYDGMVAQLRELGVAIAQWNKPIFISIGVEVNSPGMLYHRPTWAETYRKLHARLKTETQAVDPTAWPKVAFIFSVEISPVPDPITYYPGDPYVDWAAVDLFAPDTNLTDGANSFEHMKIWMAFFEEHRLPVSIQEAGATGRLIPTILEDADHGGTDAAAALNADHVWSIWFVPFFRTLDRFPIIKLWRYVNRDHTSGAYSGPPLFWNNARVDINHFLFDRLKLYMAEGRYLHADQRSLLKDWRRYSGLTNEPEPATTTTIERMRVRHAGEDDLDLRLDAYFVDSGGSWDGRKESHPEWAGISLTLEEENLELEWVAGETVSLFSNFPLFAMTDVTQIGFLLTDPVTGEECEVLVTDFVSDMEVRVLLVTDPAVGLKRGDNDAEVWTRMVSSLDGLGRLEGRLLNVLADGVRQPQVAVANGSVFFQKPLGMGHLGLPIISDIDTLDLDTPGGSGAAGASRSVELTAMVHGTRGAQAGLATASTLFPLVATPVAVSSPTGLFTGKMRAHMQAQSGRQTSLRIRQKDPLPMLIAGVFPLSEVAR